MFKGEDLLFFLGGGVVVSGTGIAIVVGLWSEPVSGILLSVFGALSIRLSLLSLSTDLSDIRAFGQAIDPEIGYIGPVATALLGLAMVLAGVVIISGNRFVSGGLMIGIAATLILTTSTDSLNMGSVGAERLVRGFVAGSLATIGGTFMLSDPEYWQVHLADKYAHNWVTEPFRRQSRLIVWSTSAVSGAWVLCALLLRSAYGADRWWLAVAVAATLAVYAWSIETGIAWALAIWIGVGFLLLLV